MGVDEIITLEDGKEYVLLFATVHNGEKYFLASEVIDGQPSEENFELLKELIIDNEFSVENVTDPSLKDRLMEIFEEQYDSIEKAEEEIEMEEGQE